jgi:cytochrome c556
MARKRQQLAPAIKALVRERLGPKAKVGDRDPKNWEFWSRDFKDGAKALAEGAKKKDAEKVHVAAKTITAACNECHSAFRDTP